MYSSPILYFDVRAADTVLQMRYVAMPPAGTFGKVDAMSEILTEYLQRLEEQQESVVQLIKNQRQLLKDGKAGASLQAIKSAAAKV